MTTKTIEERLAELEARVNRIEAKNLAQTSASPSQKKISAKEFLLTKEITSDAQKIVVLGYYLEKIEGLPLFNVDDLVGAFKRANEKRPQNMNDMVNKNVARGLIMEAEEKKDLKKAWVLTATGEKYIEEDINK